MKVIADLAEALRAQDDLEAMCADRLLITGELFTPNAFYGGDAILRAYAGRDPRASLRCVVPHAPSYNVRYLWRAEIDSDLPAVMCFPRHRTWLYERLTSKIVIPAASPYIYMLDLVAEQRSNPPRAGTIYFPSHSTEHVTAAADFDAIADTLLDIAPECRPVTVCMYWRDVQLGHHRPFVQRGFRIVSAGHMYDPQFLSRFHHLCSLHRFASSNEIGSQIPYSVKSGCSFFLYGDRAATHDHELQVAMGEANSASIDIEVERPPAFVSLFSDRVAETTAEQLAAVDYYLGIAEKRSRLGLSQDLSYADRLDRLGYRPRRPGSPRLVVSPSARRKVRSVAMALRSRLGRSTVLARARTRVSGRRRG